MARSRGLAALLSVLLVVLPAAVAGCAPVGTPVPPISSTAGPTVEATLAVALAPGPATETAPASTPTAAPTETPTATPSATATGTDTPSPTETPAPTDTPVPTDTPFPTDTPTPTPTPTPSVDWRLVSARQLTPCENRGGHSLFITVLDAAGNGIPGVPVLITWESGSQVVVTGDKPERGPGCTDFPMYGGYTVQIAEGISEVSPVMSSHERESQRCDETNDNVANSYAHYSYEVIFQRTY